MYLREIAPDTLSHLAKIKCNPKDITHLLFSYVTIQLPQRKKLQEDSNAFRKEVRRVCKKLLDCADEVEHLCTKKLYGRQDLMGIHWHVAAQDRYSIRRSARCAFFFGKSVSAAGKLQLALFKLSRSHAGQS